MRFFMTAVLLVTVTVLHATPPSGGNIIPSRHKNLFVFRAEKSLVGGTVEVFYSNGDLVTSQKLEKRKLIIDFCDTKQGEYIIRITKGNKKQEYTYSKK